MVVKYGESSLLDDTTLLSSCLCCSYNMWRTGVLDWGEIEDEGLQEILDEEDNVKTRIIFAREELKVRASAFDRMCYEARMRIRMCAMLTVRMGVSVATVGVGLRTALRRIFSL